MKKNHSNKIWKAYAACLSGLPSTYPKPSLYIYPSSKDIIHSLKIRGYDCSNLKDIDAAADAYSNYVLTCDDMLLYPYEEVLEIVLHEFGHLYYAAKHGKQSEQFFDEKLADKFAKNWKKRILTK